MLAGEFSPVEMGRITGIEAKNRDFDINSKVFSDCAEVLKKYKKTALSDGGDITNDELLGIFKAKSKK